VNLENRLGYLPLWDMADTILNVPRRRVAYYIDRINHTEPQHRTDRNVYKILRKDGFSTLQADAVLYCAARMGALRRPQLSSESIEILQRYITDRANGKFGRRVTRELEMLARIAKISKRPTMSRAGFARLTSSQDRLPHDKLLTGLTK
jgi:hypothetical protein